MYFRDNEEDKTGASTTHKIFDDQQVSTFIGQWNCFPDPGGCLKLILSSPNSSENCATILIHHKANNLLRVLFNFGAHISERTSPKEQIFGKCSFLTT